MEIKKETLSSSANSPNTQVAPNGAQSSTFASEIKETTSKLNSVMVGAKIAADMDQEVNAEKTFSPEDIIDHLNLKPESILVEFGSGVGNIILPLAMTYKNSTFYAVDVQKDLLLKLLRDAKKEHLDNVYAAWGDVEKIEGSKLPAQSADYVLMVNSFFMFEDKKSALLEARRILKDGHFLVVVDWKKNTKFKMAPKYSMRVSVDDLLSLAQEAGFSFLEKFDLSDTHYMLKFAKI